MGLREDVQKRIDKKQQEISELELKIKEASSYMQALVDTIRILPKTPPANGIHQAFQLRPGTALAKAREAIMQAGKPLHVNDLLKHIGQPADKQHKVSLSGSIAGYVRRGEIFTRPAPNTFGLIELEHTEQQEEEGLNLNSELPDTFGKV